MQGLAASLGSQLKEHCSSPEVFISLSLQGEDLGSVTAAADSLVVRAYCIGMAHRTALDRAYASGTTQWAAAAHVWCRYPEQLLG